MKKAIIHLRDSECQARAIHLREAETPAGYEIFIVPPQRKLVQRKDTQTAFLP